MRATLPHPANTKTMAAVAAIMLWSGAIIIGQAFTPTTATAAGKEATKLAEGEYVVVEQANGGAIGPFGGQIYNFHETWTLWKLDDGQYQVTGERKYEAPKGTVHSFPFTARLSRDLTVMQVTEFAPPKWTRGSGSVKCEFLPKLLDCTADPNQPDPRLRVKISMQRPYGLLWPISAFSLSGLTREAERDIARSTQIELVTFEQPGPGMPINPMVLDGELRYVGEGTVDVAGQERRAFKFSIKVALSPKLTVWTTPSGLLLAVSVDHADKQWPEEVMKLVRFREWQRQDRQENWYDKRHD